MAHPIRTELQKKGYTKDAVVVHCANCQKSVTCKWSRNPTRGMNYGRPMIEIPDNWKIVYTYGSTKQDVLCPDCHSFELGEGVLL